MDAYTHLTAPQFNSIIPLKFVISNGPSDITKSHENCTHQWISVQASSTHYFTIDGVSVS